MFFINTGLLSIHNLESEVIKRNQNISSTNSEENNTNKELASIDIQHLTMSSQEINTRLNLASTERTLRLYISPGNESISENNENEANTPYSRTPEEWQYEYIRENIVNIIEKCNAYLTFNVSMLTMRFTQYYIRNPAFTILNTEREIAQPPII